MAFNWSNMGYAAGDPYGLTQAGTWAYNNPQQATSYGETANQILDPGDFFGGQAKTQASKLKKQQDAERAAMQAQLDKYPAYGSLANKNGNLKQKYTLKWGDDVANSPSRLSEYDQRMNLAQNVNPGQNYNTMQDNLSALNSRAFGTETSPWAQKLYDQQSLQESAARDQFARQNTNDLNNSMNNMAAQGGLDSATRARMMQQANKNQMFGRQGLARDSMNQRLGIGIQDEAQRLALQQQMPGMQLQADQYSTGLQQANNQMNLNKANMWGNQANLEDQNNLANAWANKQGQLGVNQYNMGNLIGNTQGQNQYNLGAWNTQMQAMGAGRTADAMAAGANRRGNFLSGLFG